MVEFVSCTPHHSETWIFHLQHLVDPRRFRFWSISNLPVRATQILDYIYLLRALWIASFFILCSAYLISANPEDVVIVGLGFRGVKKLVLWYSEHKIHCRDKVQTQIVCSVACVVLGGVQHIRLSSSIMEDLTETTNVLVLSALFSIYSNFMHTKSDLITGDVLSSSLHTQYVQSSCSILST